jgi:hypothetical protein
MKLLKIGLYNGQPSWKQDKIKIGNLLNLIIWGICVFFALISYFFLRPIFYLPLVASIIVLSGFFFTFIGWNILS